MKKLAVAAALAIAFTGATVPVANAAGDPVPGRFCAKKDNGKTAKYKGVTIKCQPAGSRYQWNYIK